MNYSPAFLECFLNTVHAGSLTGDGVYVFLHQGVTSFSSFQLCIRVENDLIIQAAFHASSTPALIAVGEYVCRWIEGKPFSALHQLHKNRIQQELGLATTMIHHVDLVLSTFSSKNSSTLI